MSHVSRFKVLYLQACVAIASAVAGELGPMKELTHDQLAALTWVVWATLIANVVINAGNVVVASLHQPPEPKSHENNPPAPPVSAP